MKREGIKKKNTRFVKLSDDLYV